MDEEDSQGVVLHYITILNMLPINISINIVQGNDGEREESGEMYRVERYEGEGERGRGRVRVRVRRVRAVRAVRGEGREGMFIPLLTASRSVFFRY